MLRTHRTYTLYARVKSQNFYTAPSMQIVTASDIILCNNNNNLYTTHWAYFVNIIYRRRFTIDYYSYTLSQIFFLNKIDVYIFINIHCVRKLQVSRPRYFCELFTHTHTKRALLFFFILFFLTRRHIKSFSLVCVFTAALD